LRLGLVRRGRGVGGRFLLYPRGAVLGRDCFRRGWRRGRGGRRGRWSGRRGGARGGRRAGLVAAHAGDAVRPAEEARDDLLDDGARAVLVELLAVELV